MLGIEPIVSLLGPGCQGAKPYQIDDRAWAEVEAADDWYVERNPEASVSIRLKLLLCLAKTGVNSPGTMFSTFRGVNRKPHSRPLYRLSLTDLRIARQNRINVRE
jgi:hypothetical protein